MAGEEGDWTEEEGGGLGDDGKLPIHVALDERRERGRRKVICLECVVESHAQLIPVSKAPFANLSRASRCVVD